MPGPSGAAHEPGPALLAYIALPAGFTALLIIGVVTAAPHGRPPAAAVLIAAGP
jgi:hypothetical protein